MDQYSKDFLVKPKSVDKISRYFLPPKISKKTYLGQFSTLE